MVAGAPRLPPSPPPLLYLRSLGPDASSSHGVSGRLASVVTVVAVRAPTSCRQAAGLALRARAPSLPPPPRLPCEGTRPSRHPSFTRLARPPGRCFGRRGTGTDLRRACGGRGLRVRALAPRRRHRCCRQASGREAGHGKRAVDPQCFFHHPTAWAAAWPLLSSPLFGRRLREGARRAWLCGRVPRASRRRRCCCLQVSGLEAGHGNRAGAFKSFIASRRGWPPGRCCRGRRCSGADRCRARGGRGLRARALGLPPPPLLLPSGFGP